MSHHIHINYLNKKNSEKTKFAFAVIRKPETKFSRFVAINW